MTPSTVIYDKQSVQNMSLLFNETTHFIAKMVNFRIEKTLAKCTSIKQFVVSKEGVKVLS